MAEVLERKRHLIIAEQSRNDRLRCRAEYYEYVLDAINGGASLTLLSL